MPIRIACDQISCTHCNVTVCDHPRPILYGPRGNRRCLSMNSVVLNININATEDNKTSIGEVHQQGNK